MEFFIVFFFLPYVLSDCPTSKVFPSYCECSMQQSRDLTVWCMKTSELKVEDILCCNVTEKEQDMVDVKNVYELNTVGSQLYNFDFKLVENMTNLHVLNLSRSRIRHVDWDNCQLSNLEILDLSHNEIENTTKEFFTCNGNIKKIDLHGNMWMCDLFFWFIDWVRDAEDKGTEIINQNELFCFVKNITTTSLNLDYVVKMCPRNCSCRTITNDRAALEVDCRGRGWTDFPEKVPNQTRVLHLENNKIHSFRRFLNGTNYKSVKNIYIDNNHISSIAELEGLKPGFNFTVLYLSGNKLTELPVYLLADLNGFKLGGNPWNCDCKHGTMMRNFIIDQMKVIVDISNITCASTDERYPNRVVWHLSQIDLCYSEVVIFNVLDLVNGILATLIFLILVKLIYDWWHFKHTGQLPVGPIAIIQLWKQKQFRLNNMDI